MNSLASSIVNSIGKGAEPPTHIGKKATVDIAEHNKRLEQQRKAREGDNAPISDEEQKAWADYQLNDPEIAAQRDAEDEARWAKERADKRQRYLDNESGVNKVFRKINNGLIKVADVASNIISNPVGDLYQQFAPKGSVYNP